MKTLWKTINIFLLVGLLSVGVLLLGTLMPIPGNFKVKIVKSGSMEPSIVTGSIVIIKPETSYHVGDVVTFGADTKTQIPTTHRIIEIGDSPLGQSVRTKGDANDSADPRPTQMNDVHGKVIFTLPYMGYLLDFARKPIGFALLVGLPAFAVIIDEVGKIIAEIKRLRRTKHGSNQSHDDSSKGTEEEKHPLIVSTRTRETTKKLPVGLVPWPPHEMAFASPSEKTIGNGTPHTRKFMLRFQILFALLLPLTTLGALSSVGSTLSYFSDVESSFGNYLKADPLDFSVALLGSSQVDMSTGTQYVTPVFEPALDSEPIQYSLSTYATGGDITLCSLIQVESTSTFAYAGSLLLFSTGMTTTTGALPLRFSIPEGYAANENSSCSIDLIFTGKNASAGPGQGYSFTEHVPLQFYIPAVIPVVPVSTESVPSPITTPDEAIPTEETSTITEPVTEGDASTTPATTLEVPEHPAASVEETPFTSLPAAEEDVPLPLEPAATEVVPASADVPTT